ncbi:thioredoxin family protein [Nibrella viscosa]|uniref:Thioredoxin family protein n=1 Tax=Nibrella viscosa TaxID=1084524 RepID=A0ABP8KWB0_9BACT
MRRHHKAYLVAIVVSLLATMTSYAQQARGYSIGDAIASFSLKNVDGRTIGPGDYQGQKGLIVIFSSNHCPFSKAYEDRVQELNRKYSAQGYPVIAIMPNDPTAYEEDSFDQMKIRASEKNFSYPYLLDDSQSVARAFGASRTPHVFVLKRSGDRFIVEYIGAIDDNPQDASGVQRRYVEEAVNSLLLGRPVVVTTTKAIGCAIKWKNM